MLAWLSLFFFLLIAVLVDTSTSSKSNSMILSFHWKTRTLSFMSRGGGGGATNVQQLLLIFRARHSSCSRGGGGRHNMHSVPCMALASVQKQQHQSNVRMLRHARSISSSGFTSRLDQNKALLFSSFSSSSVCLQANGRR